MTPLPMQVVERLSLNGDGQTTQHVTVFFPTGEVESAPSDHPNFEAIVKGAAEGDTSILDLFNVSRTVEKRFERLSERITVKDGTIYLDGTATDNALTDAILRALDEGEDDWMPLVKFFERLLANPNEHSREQLYTWLASENYTINEDGLIVGYKYVNKTTTDDGEELYTSTVAGYAIVDDVEHGTVEGGSSEYVPNRLGSVISMPRDMVQHDPSVACHKGLHVGTWGYSGGNYKSNVLTVLVDPRDVVSVPTDSNAQKIRCCRYIVLDVNDGQKHEGLILRNQPVEEEFTESGFDATTVFDHTHLDPEDVDQPVGRSSWGVDEDYDEDDFSIEEVESTQDALDVLADAADLIGDAVSDLRDAFGRFHRGRPGSRRGPNGQFVTED